MLKYGSVLVIGLIAGWLIFASDSTATSTRSQIKEKVTSVKTSSP